MKDVENEVPEMDCFLLPLLKWASEKSGEFHRSEVMEAMADHFRLSPVAKRKLTDGGNMPCYKDRTSRSLSHLKKAGLMCSINKGSGYWKITAEGKKEARTLKKMNRRYLKDNFPSY